MKSEKFATARNSEKFATARNSEKFATAHHKKAKKQQRQQIFHFSLFTFHLFFVTLQPTQQIKQK
ncbi:hypothetical protein [uncultured Prevotella sp.]|uniref:hypothetical protein n=1 Tax=uncultured Prevotella sp. TaxID=159272 RepID=UPI002584E9F0|nr:hypothetical protein [uncultured Prevotella sp.]